MDIRKRTRPAVFGASSDAPAAEESLILDAASAIDAPSTPLPDAPLEAPAAGSAVTTAQVQMPVRQTESAASHPAAETWKTPPGWPVYLIAFAVAVLWALGPIAFALGYRSGVAPFRDDQFALAVFGLLAIGPAMFVVFAAYMVRQGQKLGAEARRAKAMAEDMLAPAMSAAARTGEVVHGVREEIVRAAEAADEARAALLALREAMAAETTRLVESTDSSIRTTRDLTTTLGRERSEMGALAAALDAQANRVTDSISQQARMVAEATELAETQLREAEGVLSARAADMAAAASEASTAARTAGEDLTRHIARLETAGAGVVDQVKAVESGLADQRTALVGLAQTLKADHEGFAQQAQAHAAKLEEFITEARASSAELADRALKGGETLRELMNEAAGGYRDLADAARAERDALGQSAVDSIQAVSGAVAEERARLEAETRAAIDALAAAAEETRAAAERHALAARGQVDQLSEAAAAAGETANAAYEARLTAARDLVEQSSTLADEAGAATAARLEEAAAAARATLAELAAMVGELERRAEQLPASAQTQVDRVRSAFAEGLAELTAQARRTAEEAQAIDAAFQARARKNFEMLGEAVRLMGGAASSGPPLAPSAEVEVPSRTNRQKPSERALAARPPVSLASTVLDEADDDLDAELEALMEPPPPLALHQTVDEAIPDPGLRPRLKLTPTATDAEFSAVFEAAGGPSPEPGEDGEGWTWKDLLASIDGADAEGERLQDILGAEMKALGVETAKLLPKARIDEIAAAVQTGDMEGAREVVKRLAPAATRRIARKLVADEPVRRQAQVFIRRYQTLVEDAAVRDPEGFLMATLLGDEAGRTFLLLDAASGDLG